MTNCFLKKTDKVENPPFFYLQQFYEFEFSPITKSKTNHLGLYDYKALQKTWNNFNYDAYLFYLGELPVGFAVINLNSQITGASDVRDVAEFFVMLNHRSKGIGREMATQLFDRYRTKWELRQLFQAEQSRNFWLKIIKAYTGGAFEELKLMDNKWTGYLQKFFSRNYIY